MRFSTNYIKFPLINHQSVNYNSRALSASSYNSHQWSTCPHHKSAKFDYFIVKGLKISLL